MVDAHINFNFQARLNKASAQKFFKLQRKAKTILPDMNSIPINEFHITLGASSYFSRTGERIKVDTQSDAIKNDYQRILSGLKSYSFNPITNLKITGFRVTDNGFIVVDLTGDQTANNIAKFYRNAHSHDAMKNLSLELTQHYKTSSDFGIHVSLGKIAAPKNSDHKAQLTHNINDNICNPSSTMISTKKKGVLSVSYNAHKIRYIIYCNIISFRVPGSEGASSFVSGSSDAMTRSSSLKPTIMHQYNLRRSSVQSTPAPTHDEIKLAMAAFSKKHSLKTRSIGIHMPTPVEADYKITFMYNKDAQILISKLGKMARISLADPCHVLLDKRGVDKLSSWSRPTNNRALNSNVSCCTLSTRNST